MCRKQNIKEKNLVGLTTKEGTYLSDLETVQHPLHETDQHNLDQATRAVQN